MAGPTSVAIEAVVTRHFEEAVALWPHRDADVHGSQRTVDELVGLDGRVSAHLDGLRIAQDHGWDESSIEENLADPGEAFVRVLLALEAQKPDTLEQLLQAVAGNKPAARGVVSAFGWASASSLRGTVRELLASSQPFRKQIGIAACAVHRVDPGSALRGAIVGGDISLGRRALRAVGELGRTDLAPLLETQFAVEDTPARFWAAWSSVLTGDRDQGLEILSVLGLEDASHRFRAMQLVLRVLSQNGARDWLRSLREEDESARDLLVGVGVAGDPSYVPWLIDQMEVPELARVSGEAFSMITGVDFGDAYLKRERPQGFASGPTDDPEDEAVSMDPDQDLSWPDPPLVRSWWESNRQRFVTGQRYLAGHVVSAEDCHRLLRDGRQGLRQAAAFELALMNADTPLFETRAPAFRQQRQLTR
jgi:uncharacterized protein (TIGR02270 family)